MKTLEIMFGTVRACKHFCSIILFCAVTAMVSQAQTLTTLTEFSGTNGSYPLGLIQDFDGSFSGTTLSGGTQGWGTAFRITSTGTLTTVHNFCSQGIACTDGSEPEGRLTQASNGDIYGTTDLGGTGHAGLIFRISSGGKFAVLHNFCVVSPCADGESPISVMQARNGYLYGTTYGSRTNGYDFGTVFALTLNGTLTTLHSFSGPDGSYPVGALLQASNGNLYGTTSQGGSTTSCSDSFAGCGTVFEITPSGTLTTLHSFDGSDGALPGYEGTLIEGADGNLYGTATDGGTTNTECGFGCGTIFKISPAGKFTTLYNFCSQMNCADGASPSESLVLGTDGNFYGTTVAGGNSGGFGTIFKITPQGVLTTLYDFCSQPNCADGSQPQTALIQATDGNFYGTTTSGGGTSGSGSIFRFSVGLGPFVKLVRDSGKAGQLEGITGQGFIGTTGVFLNGTPASFTVVSDTFVRATVPTGAKTGFVTVVTPSGTLKSNVPFRVIP